MIDYSLLKGKVAFVSGASGAIGAAISESLASAGVNLVISGSNQNKLLKLKDMLSGNVDVIVGDMSQQSEILRIIDEILFFPYTCRC